MAELSPEILALLDCLKARDELEEIARLFEDSSQAWQQFSDIERNRLIARAMTLMAERKS